MPCLLALFALLTPRIVILLVLIFSNYLETAYQTLLWPLLGFIFLPLTTLAYAFAWHQTGGSPHGFYIALIVIAALIDLGSIGGSSRSQRR